MSGAILIAALAAQTATSGTAAFAPATTPTGSQGITQSESTYVDLEGGAGYSTNPNLSLGSDTGAGFGRISAHVVHTRVSTRTTTVLSAYAQSVFYTHRFGSQQSFDISARHDAAVSEKLRLWFSGDAAYDRGGQLDTRIVGVPNVPLLPGTTLPPVLLTPGGDFLTVTGRTYRVDANVGAQWSLSPRDFVDMSTGIDHTIFKTGPLETRYTTIPVSVGYSRQISEQTTLGARVVGEFTHYSEALNGAPRNFQVITPEATAQIRLSPRLTFAADAGVSFSSVDNGLSTRHSTGFAGDANLCSSGERTQLCARASVQQQAATSAGPARVVSVGVDYSRKLNAYDTIQFSLGADRYSNPTLLVSGISFSHATYLRAAADYSKRIGSRWFAGVDLAGRKVTQNGPDPKADLSASAFVRYRFGDLQ